MENSRQELENQELSTEELEQVSGGKYSRGDKYGYFACDYPGCVFHIGFDVKIRGASDEAYALLMAHEVSAHHNHSALDERSDYHGNP